MFLCNTINSNTTSCTVFKGGLDSAHKDLMHMCLNIAKRRMRKGGGVESDARETPIHATTREYINALMAYFYKFNDDRIPTPENKPSDRGDTDQ